MNIAVIFAGGVGRRMTGSGVPKQFLNLQGKPIIIHTLEVFQNCDYIDKIIVVMVKTHIEKMKTLIKQYNISKVEKVVEGGETGQLSIYNGLCAASSISKSSSDIVLIHDGVRPFIDEQLILNNISSVKKYGSAISCVPQKETTIISDDKSNILKCTNRDVTYIARAPQSFYLVDILNAHKRILNDGEKNMIDSCSLMLKYGKKLHIVNCSSENIKITTPDDFYIAKAILESKENTAIFGG